jgi:hypothetical protein
LDKIATINAFAVRPISPPAPTTAPPTAVPSSSPTARPTVAPTTQAPTAAPSNAPTLHPCTDGSHNCDLSSTTCVVGQGNAYQCACLSGFVVSSSATQCVHAPTATPTTAPTAMPTTAAPTAMPTSVPTLDPCQTGTDQCDRASTTCAAWAFAPYYTCFCNEAAGYVPVFNADPNTQR